MSLFKDGDDNEIGIGDDGAKDVGGFVERQCNGHNTRLPSLQ